VVTKFPFRIHTILTDNSHEFQVRMYWHVGDLSILNIYNRPYMLTLNGKEERPHSTDKVDFCQFLRIQAM